VTLEIHGEDTELDKTVVEKIADPLTHLVRNAIDHGLEPSDVRATVGKPVKGTLSLSAYQKGANIFIEVRDDGRGLDRARILAKGRERGLVPPGREPTDDEVWNLIFQPGFSTAEKVTNLSGRGVGMDVVRRNIDDLQGKVTINTVPGKGTTFRIQLPLTLAMMDGLVVRVGKEVFLVPMVSVITSFRPTAKQLGRVDSTEVVEMRGAYVPVVRLYEVLSLKEYVSEITRGIIVVIDDGNRTFGLMVDELMGQLQVVVKSLESNYGRVKGVGGATILGDGQVALILDAPALLALTREKSHYTAAPGPLVLPALECA
jgi:two-component system, chemotaxis family, sensor kinase CheA